MDSAENGTANRDLTFPVSLTNIASGLTTFKTGTARGSVILATIIRIAKTAAVLLFVAASVSGATARADERFFREKIAPLFERHCVVCHQGEKPKGGVSLSTAEGLMAGGENGKVIEPGNPDESLLVEMISG